MVALFGIRDVALAVNKMDLVGYSIERFQAIAEEYCAFAGRVGIERVTCIPVSALRGDNVTERSVAMASYGGPTLLEYLESVEVDEQRARGGPCVCPCSGSTVLILISAVTLGRSQVAWCVREMRWWSRRRASARGWHGS